MAPPTDTPLNLTFLPQRQPSEAVLVVCQHIFTFQWMKKQEDEQSLIWSGIPLGTPFNTPVGTRWPQLGIRL